jgi:hypothetical protein
MDLDIEDSTTATRIIVWLEKLGCLDSGPSTPTIYTKPAHFETVNQEETEYLWSLLKDGVALCKLVNIIRPGAVSNICMNTENPLANMDNVNGFLISCEVTLGMASESLFEPNDLILMENFSKVRPKGVRNVNIRILILYMCR